MMPIEQDEDNAQSATVILFRIVSEDESLVRNDKEYSGRIFMFLDQEPGEVISTRSAPEKVGELADNMSFLVAIASCSKSKRKILVPKETEPPVREVIEGIPAASSSSKKKLRKRRRLVEVLFFPKTLARKSSKLFVMP
uniref:Uncharacterized protein n=1 Tax=Cannabis sativa TaxID=3483 RepID=A0A803NIS3_CANSA